MSSRPAWSKNKLQDSQGYTENTVSKKKKRRREKKQKRKISLNTEDHD